MVALLTVFMVIECVLLVFSRSAIVIVTNPCNIHNIISFYSLSSQSNILLQLLNIFHLSFNEKDQINSLSIISLIRKSYNSKFWFVRCWNMKCGVYLYQENIKLLNVWVSVTANLTRLSTLLVTSSVNRNIVT